MNPNLADDSKWSIVYDQLIKAVYTSDPKIYKPIPPITLNGFALNFRYLRVAANNQNAKAYWRLGAFIEFLVDEQFASVEVSRVIAPCNKPAIIKAPDFLDTYQIRVNAPYWFDELSLRIEGYTG